MVSKISFLVSKIFDTGIGIGIESIVPGIEKYLS